MNLTNHFLIAMPHLDDPIFSRSVVYIFDHTPEGTSGLIINKVLQDIYVHSVFSRLDITPFSACDELMQPVHLGGPVNEEQGYIFHTKKEDYLASINLSNDLVITTSSDVLHTVGTKHQPEKFMLALGYSGWEPMQLESEISANDWLVVPASSDIIFDTPVEERWHRAANLIGVNMDTISTKMGHA